ncbi:MAG: hypothetical protein GY847_15680, partial [Proteobacteria bacterium]|nr:hypothetical protein [Pseudomonadota bacterium]
NVFRWYFPDLGRYNRADPVAIGFRFDINPYVFVRNRPTTAVDPLGLVTDPADCDRCCTAEKAKKELGTSARWLWHNQERYAWNPWKVVRGESCFDSAKRLHGDLERHAKPKCWVTSIQLTKTWWGSDLSKQVFGIYFPVHYRVKYHFCGEKNVGDWFFDGYLIPRWGPLPKDEQLNSS